MAGGYYRAHVCTLPDELLWVYITSHPTYPELSTHSPGSGSKERAHRGFASGFLLRRWKCMQCTLHCIGGDSPHRASSPVNPGGKYSPPPPGDMMRRKGRWLLWCWWCIKVVMLFLFSTSVHQSANIPHDTTRRDPRRPVTGARIQYPTSRG